jgi:hypothetical protein
MSPTSRFATVFEDEGETGYFYALDTTLNHPIVDALHIYNAKQVIDATIPSNVQIAWSVDGNKAALIINEHVHAVFDFASKRGYCRTGNPSSSEWSKGGHDWSEEALALFR